MNATSFIVKAGFHHRRNCPVRATLPMATGGQALELRDDQGRLLRAQTEPLEEPGKMQLTWLIDDLPAGAVRHYTLDTKTAVATDSASGVSVTEQNGTHLLIDLAGDRFTSYHYLGDLARPYFHPMIGPGGVSVTRGYPMEPDVPGETNDHPHHRGLYFAHGDVNGTNNWSETPGHSRMQHQNFERVISGPVYGEFTETLAWLDPKGSIVMSERRKVTVYQTSADERLLDASLTFHACAGDVTFGDTKEGGLISVRIATSMDANKGGCIENGVGGIQEDETWGKRAQWCDYAGPVNGRTLGICLMDHPSNPHHPTRWHVRAYGLMTANPFGVRDYLRDPAQRGDWTLQFGARRTFQYRVLVHQGNAQDANLHERYQDLSNPPIVRVEAN